jgi:hypothetical protein
MGVVMPDIMEPADVMRASAIWADGQLTIRAAGTVPESCWGVSIEQSPIDIWPPQFAANRRRTTPGPCLQMELRYAVAASFTLGTRPDSIRLHRAGEPLDVPVEDGSHVPVAHDGAEFDEAVGRSHRRISFDEAFSRAVEALPSVEPETADWLEQVEVVSIHGEYGGIAGSSDLVVRVRRARPPA